MTTRQAANPHDATLEATVSYLSPASKNPVNYASIAGGKAERNTGVADPRTVRIRDARRSGEHFSLDMQGFELVEHETDVEDFSDPIEVDTRYAAEVRELVRNSTGAREVVVFDFTQRSEDQRLREQYLLRDPAVNVHNDYTPRSAVQRLRDIEGPEADRRLKSRFAIVNVWRPVRNLVQTTPIALCDARSAATTGLVSVERRARDRIGEIYQLTYDSAHRWYYFPDMSPSEALLIKTYDSDASGRRARFAPHCSFVNPAAPDHAPPRHSIEARSFAFY